MEPLDRPFLIGHTVDGAPLFVDLATFEEPTLVAGPPRRGKSIEWPSGPDQEGM